ncbi:MAG: OmpA family protein, partial [Gammaproteobacteria bacterium]
SCPNTPIGVDVDARGCPIDSDNDGVADYKDRCPGTPFGQAVDQWGCSEPGEQLAVLENVNFDFDKATLRADARAVLQQVATTLRNNPNIGVSIVGHTDATGPESYNMGLSTRRARAARDFLTRAGVDGHRMGVEGKGESQPAASNGSSAGRAKNRRVEFIVTSK